MLLRAKVESSKWIIINQCAQMAALSPRLGAQNYKCSFLFIKRFQSLVFFSIVALCVELHKMFEAFLKLFGRVFGAFRSSIEAEAFRHISHIFPQF